MNEFVAEHPSVIIALLSVMVSIISALLVYLLWTFRKSIDDLKVFVKDVIAEMKADRKEDKTSIGLLLDRMQRQETICEDNRHC
jgi:flagellar basal body-associated protein FliL